MPRVRRQLSQAQTEAQTQQVRETTKNNQNGWLNNIKGFGGIAVCKFLGYHAAYLASKTQFCISHYMPLKIINFFDSDSSITVGLRKAIAAKFVSPTHVLSNRIINSVVLGPVFEDMERVAYHAVIKVIQKKIAKRVFQNDTFADSKTGIIIRVAIAALIRGLHHLQPAVPYEIRNHPNYNDPIRRSMIDNLTWNSRVHNDAQMASNIISAIGFGVFYEITSSIIGLMGAHALSNSLGTLKAHYDGV